MDAAERLLLQQALRGVDSTVVRAPKEPNFFDVGGLGHLENPTSDLMALFMGGERSVPPWLGIALLRSVPGVEDVLGVKIEDIDWKEVRAEREVGAYAMESSSTKRLDIVFGNSTFTVGIENKVFAGTDNNPFPVYAEMLEKRVAGAKVLKCLLTPFAIEQPELDWHVVTYRRLVEEARKDFGERVASQQLTKWQIFYQELLNHLEQLGSIGEEAGMEPQDADFVVDNYSSMLKVADLLDEFAEHLFQDGKIAIEKRVGGAEVLGAISQGRANWDGRKVIRFRPARWGDKAQLVLIYCLKDDGPSSKKMMFELRAYVERPGLSFDSLKAQFAEFYRTSWPPTLRQPNPWQESKGRVFVLEVEPSQPGKINAFAGLADLAALVNEAVFPDAQE